MSLCNVIQQDEQDLGQLKRVLIYVLIQHFSTLPELSKHFMQLATQKHLFLFCFYVSAFYLTFIHIHTMMDAALAKGYLSCRLEQPGNHQPVNQQMTCSSAPSLHVSHSCYRRRNEPCPYLICSFIEHFPAEASVSGWFSAIIHSSAE